MANFCYNCGKPVQENQEVCLNCGAILTHTSVKKVTMEEGSMFGYGVLGFFVPLAGLILFIIWNTERPRAAKAAGIGALVSVCTGILIGVVALIIALASIPWLFWENIGILIVGIIGVPFF